MNDNELRAALEARFERQSEIAGRALEAEKAALAAVSRAQEAHKRAYEESIAAQVDRNATKRALTELGWVDDEGNRDEH